MPEFDVAATHEITVTAPRPVVYQTLLDTDFGAHPIVAVLMTLRAIPAFIAAPRTSWRRVRRAPPLAPLRLRAVLGRDFALLQEHPPEELVLGLTGRFWTPTGGLIPTDPAEFRSLPAAGMARAAWNFRLEEISPRVTRLSTTTRVRCADAPTRTSFLRYWTLVGRFSGLIREAILRQVRRQAEAATRTMLASHQ